MSALLLGSCAGPGQSVIAAKPGHGLRLTQEPPALRSAPRSILGLPRLRCRCHGAPGRLSAPRQALPLPVLRAGFRRRRRRLRPHRRLHGPTCPSPLFHPPHQLPQPTVKLLIDGQFVESKAKEWVDVRNPATQVSCRESSGRLVTAAIATPLPPSCSHPPDLILHPLHEQEVVSRLPLCTAEEFNAAVANSKDAFAKWRAVPVPQRARVMFCLQVGRCYCSACRC